MPVSPQTERDAASPDPHTGAGHTSDDANRKRKTLRVYVMDLWSIIPFYMGQLCLGLRDDSVDAALGSVRYHLDRSYFQRIGLSPDPLLFDFGGGLRSNRLRRLLKSGEYLANLLFLTLRFAFRAPDVLHVEYLALLDYGFPIELWFLSGVRMLGIPIVYTVHNVQFQDKQGRYKALYERAYASADVLICHGEEARRELILEMDMPADKIRVIPHGPLFSDVPHASPEEARAHLGLPSGEPLVMCLGVISEYKGIPFLLDGWKRTKRSGAAGRLVIAGAGSDSLLDGVRDKVRNLGLDDSVILRLGYIPAHELPLLHQAADILAYPYKAGTTSGALLTGLNYEKAIVATTLPFFREHLRDGENAKLVEYGDVDALAAALRELIEHPEERLRLRATRNGHSPSQISWSEIAAATRQCYETQARVPAAAPRPQRTR